MGKQLLNDTDFPPGNPPNDAWFPWLTPEGTRGKTRADALPGSGGGGGGGGGSGGPTSYFNGVVIPATSFSADNYSAAAKGAIFTPYQSISINALWGSIKADNTGDTYKGMLFESDADGLLGTMVAQSTAIAAGSTNAQAMRFPIDDTVLQADTTYCLLIVLTSGSDSTSARLISQSGGGGSAAMSWNAPVKVLAAGVAVADKAPAAADDAEVFPGYFMVCWIEGNLDYFEGWQPPPSSIEDVPTSTKWRARFPNSSGGSDLGVGLGEIRWRDASGTDLTSGGTLSASSSISISGNFNLSQALDGNWGSGNGWYASENRSGSFNSWIAYEFTSAVRPAYFECTPLNGFNQSMPQTGVIEYWDGSAWVPVAQKDYGSTANGTFNRIDIPTTVVKGVSTLWTGQTALIGGDSITAADPGWVPTLQQIMGVGVVKSATSGDKMHDLLDDIQARSDLASFPLFIVHIGTNDFGNDSGTPIGALGDTEASNTFIGYTEDLVKEYQGDNPSGRMVFLTPTQRTDKTAANAQGKTLRDYCDAIIAVANKYAVPVWDANRLSGISPTTASTLLADGLHHSDAGKLEFGKRSARWLLGNV